MALAVSPGTRTKWTACPPWRSHRTTSHDVPSDVVMIPVSVGWPPPSGNIIVSCKITSTIKSPGMVEAVGAFLVFFPACVGGWWTIQLTTVVFNSRRRGSPKWITGNRVYVKKIGVEWRKFWSVRTLTCKNADGDRDSGIGWYSNSWGDDSVVLGRGTRRK